MRGHYPSANVMKIRLRKNTFIRHVDDETILICPRSGGCTVLRDARSFIDALSNQWRSVDDAIVTVASEYGVGVDEVRDDALSVFKELVAQDFAELDEVDRNTRDCSMKGALFVRGTDDDSMPLSDFYRRHGNRPMELHLDLTDACTERCVHCYIPSGCRHYLPVAEAEKVIREFRDMQGLSVHLTGGEAMMHPEFRRICRLCNELNLNFLVFSNMTLCDDGMISFLKEVDPQFVNVSLYAMNPDIHDGITRLPGSWQKTMDAILRCEAVGVHVRIATPLLKANRHEFSALQLFADEHHMHLIPNFDVVPRCDHDCSNLEHVCSADELRETLRQHRTLFDEGYGSEIRSPDRKVCSIGTSRLYVNAKGEYYPCDSMNGYVLGTVRDHVLRDVWRCEKLNALRRLCDRDFTTCQSCEHRAFCKVCPAFNHNATGSLFGISPMKCAVTKVVHEVYGGR